MSGPGMFTHKLHSKHPKILHSMSYACFVKTFTEAPRFRQAFVNMPKATFDAVYEQHLRKNPNVKQQSLINKYLDESPQGKAVWEEMRRNLGVKVDIKDAALPDEICNLNMPEMGTFSQRTSGHFTGIESYARWAGRVEKRNPGIVFNKDKMDTAFKYKASQSGGDNGPYRKEFEKMLNRCLGKESDEYWKDR